MEANTGTRLISLLSKLSTSHRDEADLEERLQVAQALLSVAGIPVSQATADLLYFCRMHQDLLEDPKLALTCAAAAIHFCTAAKSDSTAGIVYLEDLTEVVFLPLLSSSDPFTQAKQVQVSEAFGKIIRQQGAWELALLLLQKCTYSLPEPVLPLPAELAAALVQLETCVTAKQAEGRHMNWPQSVQQLPLPAVCLLMRTLFMHAGGDSERQKEDETLTSGDVVGNGVRLLLPPVLGLLQSDAKAHQQMALKALLPVLMQAAVASGTSLNAAACKCLWETCRHLVESGKTRVGLAIMVRFHANLLPEGAEGDIANQGLNLQSSNSFWDIVRTGLGDEEPLDCKRAVFLLRKALPSSQQHPWSHFLVLYEILDEFALHLIKDIWESQIGYLHPEAGGSNSKDNQLSETPGMTVGIQHNSAARLDFSWMSVLWRRGFLHKNPVVQRLVISSFLERTWDTTQLANIPVAFVASALLPTVTSPLITKGRQDERLKQLIEQFISQYVAASSPDRIWDLIISLVDAMTQKGVPQYTLPMLTSITAAAARVSSPLQKLSENPLQLAERTAVLLAGLRAVAANLFIFHGTYYRVYILQGLLTVAQRLLPAGTLDVIAAAQLLEVIPLGMIKAGGSLHATVQGWLGGSQEAWLLEGLAAELKMFLSGSANVAAQGVPVTVNDIGVWRKEADRLAQLMLVGSATEGSLLESMLRSLEAKAQDLYHRPYLSRGIAERTMLLLISLFQMVEPELVGPDSTALREPSWLQLRLGRLVESAYDELSAFTRGTLQAFWSPLQPSSFVTPRQDDDPMVPHEMTAVASRLAPSLIAALERAQLAMLCSQHAALALLRSRQLNMAPQGNLLSAIEIPERVPKTPALLINGSSDDLLGSSPLPPSVSQSDLAASHGDPSSRWGSSPDGQRSSVSPTGASVRRWEREGSNGIRHSRNLSFDFSGRRSEGYEDPSKPLDALHQTAVQFLHCFATTPLAMPRASSRPEVAEGCKEMGARALACVADACELLCAAVRLDASLGLRPGRALNFDALLQTALRANAGAASSSVEACRWRCIDSALSICAVAGLPLTHGTKMSVLAATVEGLQAAHETSLIPLLRCLRHLLVEVATVPDIIPAAAAAIFPRDSESQGSRQEQLCVVMWSIVKPAWIALQDCESKRPALAAAFLNTILLPALFDCSGKSDHRWAVHEEDGPLQWLVSNLLESFARSPRLSALASLQLCRLWVAQPRMASVYAGAFQELLVYGELDRSSVGKEQGLQMDVIGTGQEAEEVASLLSGAMRDDVLTEYSATDQAARVAAVCCAHQLVRMASEEAGTSRGCDAGTAGLLLWRQLFSQVCQENFGRGKKHHVGSRVHRKKLRWWQALCVLVAFVPDKDVYTVVHATFDQIKVTLRLANDLSAKDSPIIQDENPKRLENFTTVKQYQESMLVRLLLRQPGIVSDFLLPYISAYTKRWEGLASAMLVAVQIVFHSAPPEQDRLLQPTVTAILPWTITHHHAIRTFSQLVLQALFERFPELRTGDPYLGVIANFMEENPDLVRLRAAMGPAIRGFDPVAATSPVAIFCRGVSIAGGVHEAVEVEGAPLPLLERVSHFLNDARAKLRIEEAEAAGVERGLGARDLDAAEAALDFQRKPQPQQHLLPAEADDSFEDWRGLLAALGVDNSAAGPLTGRRNGKQRQSVIMVASLLDRVPNLAGLARTCEVFHASLVLADKRVVKDPVFAGISVSAEQWVPIEEVGPEALIPWLSQKRAEGYTLMGLEQTAESQPLPSVQFPHKCVLLLGREREGIPPELIELLDATIEIPQLGVIRSLNVHVSGAIALYQYLAFWQNCDAA